ncbi:hypothetical protein G3O08_17590 [Cryomorpha ignava]|uniref:DUF1574 domain-containing protein n=1 Tax=Cryomorpha ignava TaxID=101383 RepID=A0A7K3WUF7_9FLAO|nr:hypothetical protein [Cryomorpha ignava]NEN25313.1 hypothetical protein [Cryomorpha ignava]
MFRKLALFIIPILIYCIAAMIFMPDVLSIQYGPTTKQEIHQSFKNSLSRDYELLILGNSRLYRGLNPDRFYCQTFNFSHDNDTYNQLYFKLKYVLDNGKVFNKVILGVDYHQFSFKSDTRNYVYGDLLGADYMNDYPEGNLLLQKIDYYLGNVNPMKLRGLKRVEDKPFQRENGQFIKPGKAKETNTVERDLTRLDFQVNYFKKIIDLCRANGITVFMVMPPLRENELKAHTPAERELFNSFINDFVDNKQVFYFNYSKNHDFKMTDFTDITHFNEAAANRFSEILSEDIFELTKTAHQ